MADPLPAIRMRRRRRRSTSRVLTTSGLGMGAALSLIVVMATLGLALAFASLTHNLPSLEALPALLDPPEGLLLQPTHLFDRSGQHVLVSLEHPAAAGKQYLALGATPGAPAALVAATQIASDPTFWANPGYTLSGLRQGDHPTIAQRLVSDLLLWDEPPGLRRALRERLLAAQITRRFGREKVMEWFLNSAYYGNRTYGADAAARVYFGKPASELTLAEAAILASVAEAPALNPLDTPDEAMQRGRDILIGMREAGLITSPAFRQALDARVTFQRHAPPPRDPMAAFANLALEQVATRVRRDRLERGGLRVITTLDYDLQLQADCALQAQRARLRGEEADVAAADGSPCEAARLLPRLTGEAAVQVSDLAGGIVVLDAASGEILALAGEATPGLDPAHTLGHPPGSLLATYVHLAAYTRGLSPGSLAWDIPSNLPPAVELPEKDAGAYLGPMRLRTALANDYLVPTLQLLAQIGPENVWRTLPQLGLTTLENTGGADAYHLLLDKGEVTLLEITHAYSIFDNLGVLVGEVATGPDEAGTEGHIRPISVLRVEDSPGNLWLPVPARAARPVVSTQLAYLIHHVLSDEVARWSSLGHPNPLEIGRPAGAKIGRTTSGQDSWTVGYTPQIVAGVWIGAQPTRDGERISPQAPAGLWHAVMQYASRDLPPTDWEQPPGLSVVEVCDPSGMLPTPECPTVVREVYLQGNEPTHFDTLYRKIEINRETGRLATVFTPPESIEARVYLVVPPEAVAWAAEAGLPTPPEDYDLVIVPPDRSGEVAITRPEMFAYVTGLVPVWGSASGEGFAFYRLQYGQGLNPQTWLQLGDDVRQPVEDGRLGTWDTRALSGLYALQLLVVRQDQRVDTATVQVTVDNQPPEIVILNPQDGQIYDDPGARTTTLRVRAMDDLALRNVDLYLDNRLLVSLNTPPFAFPWNLTPGEHSLRVQAYDQAGNMTVARVSFEVRR